MNHSWRRWLKSWVLAEFALINGQRLYSAWHLAKLMLSAALGLLHGLTVVQAGQTQPGAEVLSLDFLQSGNGLTSPQPTHVFAPPINSLPPSNTFEGILTLNTDANLNQIEILTDTFSAATRDSLKLRELPPYSFSFVMDGTAIIPLSRGPQRSDHPYWEIIPEPGVAWSETADQGWSHAALPFTLKERNQNCTHNGVMTFMYKSSGAITRAAWQVTSETCLYLKINLWGVADASYEPQSISQSAEVIAAYHKEIANRLPVKSFSSLEKDYPGLKRSAFKPPGIDDVSVYGFVINGVHYRSECPSRFGPYPFCEVLDLPSYSLAKSLIGGIGYLILISRWPEFATIPISDLIPECVLADKRWNDVTPAQLLNMTTGNYNSNIFKDDEDADSMQTFFLAESHNDKVLFSCEAWPRKSPPGTQWVYHTTDTYLLGVAMNTFLKQKLGPQADFYQDLIYQRLFKALELSPAMQWTQRTYDEESQPFTGYGLIFHSDDVARIAQALNSESSLLQHFSGTGFEAAMFRTGKPKHTMLDDSGLAYRNGFWGVNVSKWITCQSDTWVPFLSGYGGISVALFPNGSVYYYFTDGNQYSIHSAAVEANKVINYCKES